MSDTPRSDAEEIQIYRDDVTGCAEEISYVPARVARQLERENAALKVQVRELIATMEEEGEMDAVRIAELKKYNAALRDAINAMSPCKCQHTHGDACAMSSEIMALREERDALRAALDAQMKYQRDLRADRDRLDWLQTATYWPYPTLGKNVRAAIDAARKETK